MMGSTGGGPLRRREDRAKARPGASPGAAGLFAAGAAAPSFASEMASVSQSAPASGGASGRAVLSETMTLARAGGGTASLQLTIGRGERVDLRVTVRSGMVTVLARVDSPAGERAAEACRDRIAEALGEAGLRLARLFVRRGEGNGETAQTERRRRSGHRERREEERP